MYKMSCTTEDVNSIRREPVTGACGAKKNKNETLLSGGPRHSGKKEERNFTGRSSPELPV